MNCDDIKQLIIAHLPDAQVTINSHDNVHFDAVVSSSAFANKSKVQQQQLVYQALGDHIRNGSIHALALKTILPEA